MADHPLPNYNYLVDFGQNPAADKPGGGFAEVTGLKTELHITEYRDGNYAHSHVRKYAGLHTTGDVTLKRGVVDSRNLWDWIKQARKQGVDAQRDVTITLRDEAGNPVQIYKLHRVTPKGYTGPALNGKGSGEQLAIEELVLAPENIEIAAPS